MQGQLKDGRYTLWSVLVCYGMWPAHVIEQAERQVQHLNVLWLKVCVCVPHCVPQLAWEKRRVLTPKVLAFRRQYAELHPGLMRGKHTQQAQQAQQVKQAQQTQQKTRTDDGGPSPASTSTLSSHGQQRQQQVRL